MKNQESVVQLEPYRVLLLGPSRSAVGGGPTHINHLMNSSLSELFELRHFEVGSRGKESPASDEAIVVKVARLLWSPVALIFTLLSFRPAVVHINTSLVPRSFWRDLLYLLLAKVLNRKVVYQVHGGSINSFRVTNRLAARLFKWASRLPDAVVVVSTVECDSYREFARAKHLTVIPNAIDLSAYQCLKPKSFTNSRIRLVYLGRLDRDKGLFEAVQAVNILVHERALKDVVLDMAGSGPAEALLRFRLEELKLGDHVKLVGPVFGERKAKFWDEGEILVFPSYHEGMPYTVLESMAAGVPVVASRVGGIPDVVEDGKHGVLVQPRNAKAVADAIQFLVQDRERLRAMSAECIRHAREHFGIDCLAAKVTELYREVVLSHPDRESLSQSSDSTRKQVVRR